MPPDPPAPRCDPGPAAPAESTFGPLVGEKRDKNGKNRETGIGKGRKKGKRGDFEKENGGLMGKMG